ncbi:ABC transporter ATP-binding protein [Sulfurimonas sp. HSL-3221]|uniref:ABC transporter ATP-binding protein n=1 Tax=Sulfurimonadaceae TaxID=2771471 RepID=UPI001E3DC504|nr:ABC transporter ATP-binding protein [Sulfurimonas sp. HSL-3221]UFS62388.1 ABC transporter ATP-binding protein [Sulfurimonas sp. HSL-3221]
MIELRRVNKYFYKDTEREVHALRDIDLAVATGEYGVITGPSGCGKTTLLNAIGALDAIDSGSITIDGTELSGLDEGARSRLRLEQIGFVFQAYNLVPVLTVRENIGFIMKLRGFAPDAIETRVAEVAKLLEIEEKLDAMPGHISGGQQQRVAVARAVAAKPKLILADEPTANLDSRNSEHLMAMMKQLNAVEKITILFSSHDDYVVEQARRIIKLSDGQVVP